jgi:hypothetical protein
MILTAHQPVYLPWLGLFHKIALSEKFCIFDMVQYQTKDFNNRNKIKTKDGSFWLTVPVESKDHFNKKLIDIKIIQNGWNKKHFKSILFEYKKAKFLNDYIDDIENFYLKNNFEFLADLCTEMLLFFLDKLDINLPVVKASSYNFQGEKSDLVLDMCLQLEANNYIFGAQGKTM